MEGYLSSRCFIVLFVIATAVFAPAFSPIHILYALNHGLHPVGDPSKPDSYSVYMLAAGLAVLCLVLLNHMMVRRYMRKNHREHG
jgi:hypothetical protein